MAEQRPRLDTPREVRRQLVRRPSYDADSFGVFAEQFARYMGTARFLLWMTVFVLVWVLFNAVAPDSAAFDAYPYIFLTLMLSLQASYAAIPADQPVRLCGRAPVRRDEPGRQRAEPADPAGDGG